MSGHICQLAVQGALRRVIVHALHVVLLESADINEEFSYVVGALAVQTRHHISNMR